MGTAIVLIGFLLCWSAGAQGVIRTVGPQPATGFNPFMYALDTFLPIVDFGLESAWRPDVKAAWRPISHLDLSVSVWLVQGYLWFEILTGWVISTLAVVALTGVMRRS